MYGAAGDAGKPYQPLITFIISQKRHHTRLFVQNPRDGDRSGNVPAGTVVDTGITSTQDFDFYLTVIREYRELTSLLSTMSYWMITSSLLT